MKGKEYKVYYHKNKINNKYYIGITKQNVNKRWGKNGKNYYTQYFGYAIQKYGWDNFEHGILFDNLTETEAKNKEIELIKKYNSLHPNGYNLTVGGDTNPYDIICLETGEIINGDIDGIQKYLDKHYNIFRNKITPQDIIDCCKYNIRKIKRLNKKEYFHFQYIKHCCYSIEYCEKKYEEELLRRPKRNKEKYRWVRSVYKVKSKWFVRNECSRCKNVFSYECENKKSKNNIRICPRCKERNQKLCIY